MAGKVDPMAAYYASKARSTPQAQAQIKAQQQERVATQRAQGAAISQQRAQAKAKAAQQKQQAADSSRALASNGQTGATKDNRPGVSTSAKAYQVKLKAQKGPVGFRRKT